VAPADGTVTLIDQVVPPTELNLSTMPMTRISIFLSVFDAHVQRAPVAGEVVTIKYRPGKFLSADKEDASADNERNSVWIRTPEGIDVVAVQIAGLIARRIVCSAKVGDKLALGETYGLIRFGSRLDTYFPEGANVLVEPGQRAVAGETVLAELPR
jgi:phosphatidylserine decarboxylase